MSDMPAQKPRIVVLISGRGRNLEAIHQAIERGELNLAGIKKIHRAGNKP